MDKKIKDLQVVVDRIKKDEGVAYGILADIKVLNDIHSLLSCKPPGKGYPLQPACRSR
jgi:hypothetical protein